MPDVAQVNRSLSTIRTELEYLRDAGILSPPQLQSIMAQLPVRPSITMTIKISNEDLHSAKIQLTHL